MEHFNNVSMSAKQCMDGADGLLSAKSTIAVMMILFSAASVAKCLATSLGTDLFLSLGRKLNCVYTYIHRRQFEIGHKDRLDFFFFFRRDEINIKVCQRLKKVAPLRV